MTFNLLISCMHQSDASIIEKSNVQSDVVVVNQCDSNSVEEFDFVNKKGRICHAKFICTTERGLSKSRNMAIRNSWGDVCQICDDDEYIEDNTEDVILKAYKENPDVALIAFSLMRKDISKTYPKKKKILGFKQILKTSSLQITFSRKLMGDKQVWFDEKMGSGTGNGGGEENMFMLECRRKHFKMLYCPDVIATVLPSNSQWFHGYTKKFFEDTGWINRRLFGFAVGSLYSMYTLFSKRRAYVKHGLSIFDVAKSMLNGFVSKR